VHITEVDEEVVMTIAMLIPTLVEGAKVVWEKVLADPITDETCKRK
jgi:hypothetical protein